MKPAHRVVGRLLPLVSVLLLTLLSACGEDATDADEDGYSPPADCDDGNTSVHPGAAEACNGIDDNCDGSVDEGVATDAATWYADADGDAHGAPAPTLVGCTAPPGWVANADDCDDGDPAVHPQAVEVCGNGIDDDCDGAPGDCRLTGRISAAEADVTLIGGWMTAAGFELQLGDIAGTGALEVLLGEATLYETSDCASAMWGGVWPYDADRMPIVDLPLRVCDTENYGVGTDIGVGDLDGDGHPDLLVAMPNAALTDPNEGMVGLWYGPMAVGDTAWWTADSRLQGGVEAYTFGSGLAVGDFDADGQADVVVAAYLDHTALSAAGAVFAFRGPVGRNTYRDRDEADVVLHGDTSNQYFGIRVHTLPDFDHDGDDELVVGGPHEDGGGLTDAGVVRVYTDILGGDSTVSDADFVVNGTSMDEGLGWTSAAGDLNGDGLGDLAIGTPDGGDNSGSVLVWFGPMAGVEDAVPSTADLSIVGTTPYGHLGNAVSIDDVDGDGHDDLLVGTVAVDTGVDTTGYLLVYYGPFDRGSFGAGDADLVIAGVEPEGWFGYGEPHAGDIDGDGVPDLVIAAPMADLQGLNSDSGVVYIFRGLGL